MAGGCTSLQTGSFVMTEDDAIAFSASLPHHRVSELGWHSTRHPSVQTPRGVLWADLERTKPPVKRGYGVWVVLTVLGVLAVIVAGVLGK